MRPTKQRHFDSAVLDCQSWPRSGPRAPECDILQARFSKPVTIGELQFFQSSQIHSSAGFLESAALIRDKSVSVCALLLLLAGGCFAHAQTLATLCPRPVAGAEVENPPELRSKNGVLELRLHLRYQQT